MSAHTDADHGKTSNCSCKNSQPLPEEEESLQARLQAAQRELAAHRRRAEAESARAARIQRQLERARDRYAELYDFAPLAQLTLDEYGRIREINLAGTELLGVDRDHALHTPLIRRVAADDHGRCFNHLQRCNDTPPGQPVVSELRLSSPGGAPTPVQIISRPGRSDEGEVVFRTAILDVTSHQQTQRALHESEARRKQLEQALKLRQVEAQRKTDQLRALAAQLGEAEQRERQRLARLLHDHLQQLLAAARMHLALVRTSQRDQPMLLEHVDDLLGQSIEASRSLAIELSPPILREAGLPAAMHWLARWMKDKHGQTVHVDDVREIPAPDEPVRLLLFDAARELLFNSVKHAGTGEAWLELDRDDAGQTQLTVRDEGAGFDPAELDEQPHASFGLFALRERVAMMGGRFDIHSSPGQGTRVVVALP
ncbi:MAG: ATP-binding protein [Phycisphaeraceae bacterium]